MDPSFHWRAFMRERGMRGGVVASRFQLLDVARLSVDRYFFSFWLWIRAVKDQDREKSDRCGGQFIVRRFVLFNYWRQGVADIAAARVHCGRIDLFGCCQSDPGGCGRVFCLCVVAYL